MVREPDIRTEPCGCMTVAGVCTSYCAHHAIVAALLAARKAEEATDGKLARLVHRARRALELAARISRNGGGRA